MTLKNLFSIVALTALTLFVACDNKGNETDNGSGATTFVLEQTEMEFSCDGGLGTVNYTITNPVQGGVVLTDCSASWIKDLSTATYGSIKFTVAPNYTNNVREAAINVQYTGIEGSFSVTVRQAASEAPVFSYKVVYTDPRTILLDVVPADKETAFITGSYSKSHIEAFNLGNDIALFGYHLQSLSYEADRAGQSFLNYLQNVSYRGEALNVEFTDLNPDTEYVVFSYHIDLANATIIGDIYRETILTGKPAQSDATFDMTLSVENNVITQDITVSDEQTYFYTGYWKVNEFYMYYGRDAVMEEVFPAKWNETVIIQQSYGKSVAQILEEFCKQGSQSIVNTGLANYTEYVFYVFAVDTASGFVASEPVIATATTTSVQDSGVTIDITVEDIFARTANVYWKASSKSAQFERSVLTMSQYEALGASDQERFENIRKQYGTFYVATGDTDMNLYNLEPNTTYVAFAYGVDGETPNTRIYTTEFRTLSDTPGSSNISLSLGEHYNLAEVAAVDATHWGDYAGYSDSALLTATISGAATGDKVYIMWSTFPLDYYSDDAQWLRDVANDKWEVNCYSNYNFIFEYEREYSIIAVAQDSNGNYGRVFTKSVILYRSDDADVASYVYKENK